MFSGFIFVSVDGLVFLTCLHASRSNENGSFSLGLSKCLFGRNHNNFRRR